MNHIYRSVWNEKTRTFVAVSEIAKTSGKKASTVTGTTGGARFSLKALVASLLLAFGPPALAAPTGGQISAGCGTIAQASLNTTITQSSQNLAINWQSFGIAANEAVRFNQPSASAIALNRVLGQDPSQILGNLSANGQVFVLNPNGVLFGAGSQVNVGGLVASTLSLSDADFMAGNYSFSGTGGAVVNQGALTATDGGYIALLAPEARNEGVISARLGIALLAAGDKVTLNLNNGSLLGYSIDQGSLHALADNKQLIQADGGQVLMSAKAANALATAVVNSTGIIEARTIQNINGTIKLMGDMQVGTVNVGGTLDASAPTGGNGGFVETSAAHVKVADSARITTLAANGLNGTWLIDPVDFTIAATGGDMTGAAVGTALAGGNFTIMSTSGASGTAGNVNVNDVVSWSANTLTLNAQNNININATMNGSGSAGLALEYGQGAVAAGNTGVYNVNAPVNLAFTGSFSTKLGSDGAVKNYTILTALGAAGSTTGTDLQGVNGDLAGNYVLGMNIDATATSTWNAGAGFSPLGNSTTSFTGTFNGLGHTISNMTINLPSTSYVGLFGKAGGTASISNIGLLGGSVTGNLSVGGLVGGNYGGAISNSYATANVSSVTNYAGGLVGINRGTISNSFASGSISGVNWLGGLAAWSNGTITNTYATGSVSGTGNKIGGLLGENSVGGTLSNSYATGSVSGTGGFVGALLGVNYGNPVSNSYWNSDVYGSSAAGTGLTTAQMKQMASFSGWDIANAGGSTSVWRIYEGSTAPLLRSFMTSVTLTPVYDGSQTSMTDIAGYTADVTLDGSKINSSNVGLVLASTPTPGSATATLYGIGSSQLGYDISFASRTINGTGSAANDLAIVNPLSWSSGTLLLQAQNNISINAALSGAGLTLAAGGSIGATVGVNAGTFILSTGNWLQNNATLPIFSASDFRIAGGTFTRVTGGDGSLATPYQVADIYGVQGIIGNLSGNYVLTGDIDASGTVNWNGGAGFVPLGDNSTSFTGSFDGMGYSINGLTMATQARAYVGLFGYNAGTISNVGLLGGSITGTGAYGSSGTAGTAGTNGYQPAGFPGSYYGTNGGNGGTGGLGGSGGNVYIGGLAGYNTGTISGSYATATISATGGAGGQGGRGGQGGTGGYGIHGGGAAGGGGVGGTGGTGGNVYAGGLTGYNTGTIGSSYATGAVSATGGAGGLGGQGGAGGVGGSSYWTARAGSNGNTGGNGGAAGAVFAGGLTGYNAANLNNSYATGTVTAHWNTGGGAGIGGTGGIGGYCWSSAYCWGGVGYAASGSSGSSGTGGSGSIDYSGGLVGYKFAGTVSNSYWDTVTSGQATSWGGVGLSTSNMMTQANFISATAANGNVNPVWDFTNTWVMYEGNTAPLLRSFMTSLTVSNGVKTYDGQTAGNSAFGLPANNIFGTLSYTGTASGSVNAGSYTVTGQGGLYSNQQGYIISYADGTLTIDPKAVNLTGSRVYDGTADVAANMLSLGGLVGAETLTLSGTGTLANKNVGTGKTVTLGSLTLGDGTGLASNYTFTGGTQTVDITAKALTLTGITAINKTYDATTNATVDASAASYTGLILGDAVSVSATGTFADKNVGAGKTVTLSSSYTGADIGNYSITDQTTTTADIAKADLAVSGLTASNKTYDASTAATLVGTATITALGSDVVTLGGTASGAFVDKNVGTGKAVIVSGHTISGADAGNYNLVQQTGLTADIAKADLAVSGLTASNKTYDASTAATLVGTATITALGSDVVTLGGTASGAFVDKNVGTGKAVTVSGHTISGVDAGNYNLVQQTGLTADIAQKALTLTGVTANNKTYDGSTAATLGGTAAVAALGSDVVSVGGNGSGMFIDKNVGSGKPVIVSGFTLVGADAGNYSVVQPAGVTADITSAPSGGISPTVAQAITVLPGGESLLPAFSAAVNSVTTPAVNPVVVAMNRPNSLLPAAAPNAAAPDAQPDSDPAADNREETSASKAAGVNLQVDGPSIDMAGAVSIMDGGIRLPNDMMVSQRDE